MTEDEEFWFEDVSGPLIRPYSLTRGRTVGSGNDLDILTLVGTARSSPRPPRAQPEHLAILRLCRTPHAIAEVAALLKLPLGVTKILVGDLVNDGSLVCRAPVNTAGPSSDPDLLHTIHRALREL
ncbi:DUF742 domain-containing protein [Nocardia bovistercoris]|uniref:DUF742 domain-containing protein n=1 Tax=Nocardia bovistercoris TaxID=2785916 RepID=A0A931IE45_9NOCA|nr:DUF742 domain-containing protein [Nocardia bovistercoris]MBH0779784.1 DUF742 domain-containing protein [Nocardia bovistercoris]